MDGAPPRLNPSSEKVAMPRAAHCCRAFLCFLNIISVILGVSEMCVVGLMRSDTSILPLLDDIQQLDSIIILFLVHGSLMIAISAVGLAAGTMKSLVLLILHGVLLVLLTAVEAGGLLLLHVSVLEQIEPFTLEETCQECEDYSDVMATLLPVTILCSIAIALHVLTMGATYFLARCKRLERQKRHVVRMLQHMRSPCPSRTADQNLELAIAWSKSSRRLTPRLSLAAARSPTARSRSRSTCSYIFHGNEAWRETLVRSKSTNEQIWQGRGSTTVRLPVSATQFSLEQIRQEKQKISPAIAEKADYKNDSSMVSSNCHYTNQCPWIVEDSIDNKQNPTAPQSSAFERRSLTGYCNPAYTDQSSMSSNVSTSRPHISDDSIFRAERHVSLVSSDLYCTPCDSLPSSNTVDNAWEHSSRATPAFLAVLGTAGLAHPASGGSIVGSTASIVSTSVGATPGNTPNGSHTNVRSELRSADTSPFLSCKSSRSPTLESRLSSAIPRKYSHPVGSRVSPQAYQRLLLPTESVFGSCCNLTKPSKTETWSQNQAPSKKWSSADNFPIGLPDSYVQKR